MANYLGNDLLMTHIDQYLNGTAPGGIAALGAFLQQHNITPADVAATLQAKGRGDASTVSEAVAGNPELSAWANGGQAPAAGPATPPNPYISPPPQQVAPGGQGGLTLAPNPPGGNNTYTGPAAAPQQPQPAANPYAPTSQQPGMPNLGTYQPNPTGNPYTPMAGGQGGQGGQQGGNPYMPGDGRQQGWAPPWDNANPNTQWMAGQISQGVTDHLQRNLLPGIRSQASMAGGLGGSRQGIAEGLAVGDAAKGLSSSLAGLYGGQYNQDRNYGLANDALDLNVYNSNQNWMRTGQQDQIGLVDKMLGWNQQGLQTATQAQNTPLNYYQQFTNAGTQLGGMGSQQSTPYYGNPVMGAIGGAQLGTNIYNAWNKPAGS